MDAIELAPDNVVLGEFLTSPVFDTAYYASQVCLQERGGRQAGRQAGMEVGS